MEDSGELDDGFLVRERPPATTADNVDCAILALTNRFGGGVRLRAMD
jgi:hypothetical protein